MYGIVFVPFFFRICGPGNPRARLFQTPGANFPTSCCPFHPECLHPPHISKKNEKKLPSGLPRGHHYFPTRQQFKVTSASLPLCHTTFKDDWATQASPSRPGNPGTTCQLGKPVPPPRPPTPPDMSASFSASQSGSGATSDLGAHSLMTSNL